MKSVFLKNNGCSRLILLFGGWGSGPELFSECSVAEEYDLLMCYDYRNLSFDYGLLETYTSIRLIAWSMGVWAASETFAGDSCLASEGISDLASEGISCLASEGISDDDSDRACRLPLAKFEKCIAFGGTPYPVDSDRGISPEIFFGTLRGMSPLTLNKFRRRMCGKNLDYYLAHLPDRSAEELAEELESIAEAVHKRSHRNDFKVDSQYIDSKFPSLKWDAAFAGEKDMIFLPSNQYNAWHEAGLCLTMLPGVPHYDKAIFDKLIACEI